MKALGIASIADSRIRSRCFKWCSGVYSARYAGKNPTYKENCEKLLHRCLEVLRTKKESPNLEQLSLL